MEFFKSKKFIFLAIGAWIINVFALACWKFDHNLFNGLDLAIYNQALSNTINGKLMSLSIHPHNYFGDHFEPILFLFVPFYFVIKHALTLVLIQTIIIGLTAWPIYKLGQKYLSGYWPMFFAISWLLNPFVHAASVFEFHALALTACFLIWLIYFYKTEKFWLYILFTILVLLTREDAALSLIALNLIVWFEKKQWRWFLPTLLITIIYFVFAMKMVTFFSPENHYKFISYYQWLGTTQKEIIVNALSQPWLLLPKLFRFQNFVLLLSLLMPTGFIALYRPKWLLLSLPAFLGYALTGLSSASIILVTHYAIILLPGFYLASMVSLKSLLEYLNKNNLFFIPVVKIILIISLVYCFFTIGLGKIFFELSVFKTVKTDSFFLKKEESVIAPFSLLTRYSSREKVFSLKYLLTGYKQLSNQPFVIPPTDWLILDNEDLIYFSATNPQTPDWQKQWDRLDDNLRNRLNEMYLTNLSPTLAYFSNIPSNYKLVEEIEKQNNDFEVKQVKTNLMGKEKLLQLLLNCNFQTNNQVLHVKNYAQDTIVSEYDLPFLWGMYRAGECNKDLSYSQLISVPQNTSASEITINTVDVETKINSLGVLSINPKTQNVQKKVLIDFEK